MPDHESVVHRLRLDAATAEAARTFREAGVESILLKGQAVEAALYGRFERQFGDIDLLVEPTSFERAEELLESIGYSRVHGAASLAETSVHAREFVRGRVFVDLHHHVPGVGVRPEVAWSRWATQTVTAQFPSGAVVMLGRRAVLLMVCLSAARENAVTADVTTAVACASDEDWRGAWTLALALEADAVMVVVLSRLPAGQELLDRCHFEAGDRSGSRLLEASDVPLVGGLVRLRKTRGFRARVAAVAREVVPSPDGLRYWRPAASRSRTTLALYYVYRPIYLVTRLPRAAMRVWTATRR